MRVLGKAGFAVRRERRRGQGLQPGGKAVGIDAGVGEVLVDQRRGARAANRDVGRRLDAVATDVAEDLQRRVSAHVPGGTHPRADEVLRLDVGVAVLVLALEALVAQPEGQQDVLLNLPAVFDVLRRLIGLRVGHAAEHALADVVAGGRDRTAAVVDDIRVGPENARCVGRSGHPVAVGAAAGDLQARGVRRQLVLVETGTQRVLTEHVFQIEAIRLGLVLAAWRVEVLPGQRLRRAVVLAREFGERSGREDGPRDAVAEIGGVDLGVLRRALAVQRCQGELVGQVARVLDDVGRAADARRQASLVLVEGRIGRGGSMAQRRVVEPEVRRVGREVVADAGVFEVMAVGDVPVELEQIPLVDVLRLVPAVRAERRGVGVAQQLVHVGRVARTLGRRLVGGDEEEQLVLDDRAADVGADHGLRGLVVLIEFEERSVLRRIRARVIENVLFFRAQG